MSQAPRWLAKAIVLAIHEEQLVRHGGPEGLLDLGALESALDRPKNLLAYGSPDTFDMAASYAYGISRNHPFVDGNKPTSFVVCLLFLRLNGFVLTAPKADRLFTWLALSDGRLSADELARWLRDHSVSTS